MVRQASSRKGSAEAPGNPALCRGMNLRKGPRASGRTHRRPDDFQAGRRRPGRATRWGAASPPLAARRTGRSRSRCLRGAAGGWELRRAAAVKSAKLRARRIGAQFVTAAAEGRRTEPTHVAGAEPAHALPVPAAAGGASPASSPHALEIGVTRAQVCCGGARARSSRCSTRARGGGSRDSQCTASAPPSAPSRSDPYSGGGEASALSSAAHCRRDHPPSAVHRAAPHAEAGQGRSRAAGQRGARKPLGLRTGTRSGRCTPGGRALAGAPRGRPPRTSSSAGSFSAGRRGVPSG